MHNLDSLNERQREAAAHTDGPLLIIAGAGAGKTKTITHRIAHLIDQGVHARSILAVTFTNKAAAEMRERISKLLQKEPPLPSGEGWGEGIQTERVGVRGTPLTTTFHALGVRLLREFHEEAGLSSTFMIWDRDDSVRAVKRIAEGLGIGDPTPRALLSALSRRKGEGLSVNEFEAEVHSHRDRSVAMVWRAYEKALAEEGALDFDDLLGRALTLLQKRPDVLEKLRARWSYLTVDEYQDTNRAQYEIVRLLAGERKNLCVVGDGDQNIYSWRGAQMEHLLAFEEQFPGAKVVLLEQNYRSTRTILSVANAVITKNKRRKEKNLFTDNETGEPVTVYGARNEIDEAWFVAQSIARLMEEGMSAGEIAILYRENFQSRALEEALLSHGIPYRVLGVRFFERAEVKDTLAYLRAALNPQNKQDIARIIGVPPRGIGKVTLDKMLSGQESALSPALRTKVQKFRDTLAKIKHAAETLPAPEAVRFAAEESGIMHMLEEDTERSEERLGNISELINLAVRYDEPPTGGEPPHGILRLLEDAALESEQDNLASKEERKGVSLMTVHASKGLEFDAVFITGLEQGLFPSLRAGDGDRDNEEERRLFYVAVTRARKRLFVSFAHERFKYGQRESTLPSEFLADIDTRLTTPARPRRSLLDETFID